MERSRMRIRALRIAVLATALSALVAMAGAGGAQAANSLYTGPAPRPGPDLLYGPLANAPQLQNAPGVCGALRRS